MSSLLLLMLSVVSESNTLRPFNEVIWLSEDNERRGKGKEGRGKE